MTLFVWLILLVLCGCGLKVITEYDSDRYCFGCQTAGYAQCKGSKDQQHVSLTPTETERILSIVRAASVRVPLKGEGSGSKASEKSLKSVVINLEGYKQLK